MQILQGLFFMIVAIKLNIFTMRMVAKLKKEVYTASSLTNTKTYAGSFIYANDTVGIRFV